ncbi:Tfp pilus assembly protein PilF [Deinococcus irradiatisoli]|uniref:Tfp pilus assembly protein PilF n=1 Tax=Deinococcus irradiatisoli TaxID=2202254 RepID=A0A2Z3JMN7_9DEIO|nr:tetratricopeptide repeat protein [Deinococcus irradiatisoli]AWN24049.1 Tfp pilus assembly protein PilF [Deinococcus irradiatisoli]
MNTPPLPSLLAPAFPAPARSFWRRAALTSLTLALAAAPLAQAQTMVDTLQTINISNTLDQQNVSSGQAALDRARALQTQLTQPAAQAAPTSAAPGAANPVPTAPAATPLTDAQSAKLKTAKTLLSQSKWSEARAIYEELIAENYQQPEPHFGLALSLFSLGDLTGARFELNQFVALAPNSFEGPYNLGIIASRNQEYDEALKQFTAAAALSAQATPAARRQVLEALAGEQNRRQDYAGLSSTLSAALAIDPNDVNLQYRLGQAVALSANGAGALPLLYAALQNDATRPGAALLIADIYAKQQLPDRAVRELDNAAGQFMSGTDRARLLVRKAQLLEGQKLLKPAVQAAQEAVKSDSRSVSAYAALGGLLASSGDLGGSADAWKKAVQLDPKNASVLLNLAAVQLALGQNPEARHNAAVTLTMTPSDDNAALARAAFVQGVAAYRLKDYAAAAKALDLSAAKQASAETSLWLGLSRYALKDYPAAITALTNSVQLGSTLTARLNLGAALLAAGRFAEAEPTLRSVVVEDPKNAAAWYQLGLSRKAQGKDAEARTSFATAVKLGYAPANAELK